MKNIIPVDDLLDKFTDIYQIVHETQKPIFLTKNGLCDMVIMSMEVYENLHFENEVYFKLQEAEKEANKSFTRYSSQKVLTALRKVSENTVDLKKE